MTRCIAIGIDLGTTNSCAAIFRNGKVEIIPNEQGNNTTPSYVAFTDRYRLLGNAAKSQASINVVNTIFDMKRLLGKKYDDAEVQSDKSHWPFDVVNIEGKPKVQIEYKRETRLFEPEILISMTLAHMKQIAESYLERPVTDVVVTAPTRFNFSQKEAIHDACLIAGLNPIRILNDPAAASLVYGFHGSLSKANTKERRLLVFDLGGGCLNVAIIYVEEDIFEVRSLAGDCHLGGQDFDNRLMAHFLAEFKRQTGCDNVVENKRALWRLRMACEKAKSTLSSAQSAGIELDSWHEGVDFYSSITRQRFEELNADLFQATLKYVEDALRGAKMDKSRIEDILLVGCSTRIPKIQALLQEFFGGKELNRSLHPKEAVATGAALQAAALCGQKGSFLETVLVMDVAPHSLVGLQHV